MLLGGWHTAIRQPLAGPPWQLSRLRSTPWRGSGTPASARNPWHAEIGTSPFRLLQAKNLLPSGGSQPTQTAKAVVELQEQLPDAKVLYSSATGASEPKQLA